MRHSTPFFLRVGNPGPDLEESEIEESEKEVWKSMEPFSQFCLVGLDVPNIADYGSRKRP